MALASASSSDVRSSTVLKPPGSVYRGLFKNEQHLFSQFALVDLYLVRHLIVPAG